ncbi:hypothetical protein [Entomobacter blattae]|uniref:Uncharacterized protein n=1 Tax=Entomobacter blattae TaxID=2762277 RepID=A0A7H1NS60_9PROT|nr:hypothetical protein [Entomobacter blattae]QNT78620.1 hypothetical protein JGUZn3_13950 [Entomobacter blattae]
MTVELIEDAGNNLLHRTYSGLPYLIPDKTHFRSVLCFIAKTGELIHCCDSRIEHILEDRIQKYNEEQGQKFKKYVEQHKDDKDSPAPLKLLPIVPEIVKTLFTPLNGKNKIQPTDEQFALLSHILGCMAISKQSDNDPAGQQTLPQFSRKIYRDIKSLKNSINSYINQAKTSLNHELDKSKIYGKNFNDKNFYIYAEKITVYTDMLKALEPVEELGKIYGSSKIDNKRPRFDWAMDASHIVGLLQRFADVNNQDFPYTFKKSDKTGKIGQFIQDCLILGIGQEHTPDAISDAVIRITQHHREVISNNVIQKGEIHDF